MRIAFLTPFGSRSDVGAFSRNLLRAARQDHADRLAMVLCVNPNGETYFFDGPQLTLGEGFDEEVLRAFDFVCYNIGNNQENHRWINRLALRFPGVVIVHDLVMQHYLAWEIFERRKEPVAYADLIGRYYGANGLDVVAGSRILSATRRPRHAPWDSPYVNTMPLIEPFVASAAAVVVHSGFAEKQIAAHTRAPILRLALPWDQKPSLSEAELAAWAEATSRSRRTAITCFGHINRTKCLEVVIRGLSAVPGLAERTKLLIAGFPGDREYLEELRALVEQLGLQDSVSFELAVSMERLQEIKLASDIFVNIRYPNTESASGSLVEQLNAGKPVIVYDSGCYAEVPHDACVKIPIGAPPAEVGRAMARLIDDPALRIAVGAAGRAYVRRMSASDYIGQLADFLDRQGTEIRRRTTFHRRRRAMQFEQLEAVDMAADGAWAAKVAEARTWLAPLVDDAPALDLRSFMGFDHQTLRLFICCGIFGHEENLELQCAIDELLINVSRAEAFAIVRQAYYIRAALADPARQPHIAAGRLLPEVLPLLAGFGPEAFAAACYMVILGRQPGSGETTSWVTRLVSGDTPLTVARQFLDSEEYARRGAARRHGERVVQAAARARLPGWWERADLLELRPDAPVSFTTDNPAAADLAAGMLYPPEAEGAWSRGSLVLLPIRLGVSDCEGLAIELVCQLPGGAGPRTLAVYINSRRALLTEVSSDGWQTLRLPLDPVDLGMHGELALILDCAQVFSPAQAGIGNDPRLLGIMLRSVTLCDLAQKAAPPCLVLRERFAVGLANPRAAALLGDRWYGLEPMGAWSSGQTGTIRFRLPEFESPMPLYLGLRLRVFGTDVTGPRTVVVRSDGTILATATFENDAAQTIHVRLDRQIVQPDQHGDITLELDGGSVVRPVDLQFGPDGRSLGICLQEIVLLEHADTDLTDALEERP